MKGISSGVWEDRYLFLIYDSLGKSKFFSFLIRKKVILGYSETCDCMLATKYIKKLHQYF